MYLDEMSGVVIDCVRRVCVLRLSPQAVPKCGRGKQVWSYYCVAVGVSHHASCSSAWSEMKGSPRPPPMPQPTSAHCDCEAHAVTQ